MVGIQRISNPLEDAFSFRLILHFLGVAIHHAMATGTVIASEMPRSISTITPIVDSKSHRISFKRRNQPFPRSRLKIKYPANDFRIVRETYIKKIISRYAKKKYTYYRQNILFTHIDSLFPI